RIVTNRDGLPKTMFRDGRTLTPPSSKDPESIAREFLRNNRALFPMTAAEIDGLRLVVNDASGGAVFLSFNQTLNGIDVYEGLIKFTLSATGQIVHVGADEVVPDLLPPGRPRLTVTQAVNAAYGKTGLPAPALTQIAQ